jgi:hypothetical protein
MPRKDPLLTGAVPRCSFCNKSARDVPKMVAGPTVHICSECVDICNDVLRENVMLSSGFDPAAVQHSEAVIADGRAIRCALCQAVHPVAEALRVPEKGWLCWKCAVAVREALEARQ